MGKPKSLLTIILNYWFPSLQYIWFLSEGYTNTNGHASFGKQLIVLDKIVD